MTLKILEVNKITKILSNTKILNEVNFSVEKGEIYGFLGPNGAGKTTTMKAIMGLIEPDFGEIKIFGEKLNINSKQKIGFMPENTYLYKHLTGIEFLKFNGGFFGLKGDILEKKVQELLHKLGLHEAGNKLLNNYSKGMLQRIGLAQSIINDPEILFLDEPMSGLDPIGRKLVKDIMLEQKQKGTTIFFNTHILADVEKICDKFSIINHGNIVIESMPVKDLQTNLEDFFIQKISGV